jgi:hypothetical protein
MKVTKSKKPNFGQNPKNQELGFGIFEIDQFWLMDGMGLVPKSL